MPELSLVRATWQATPPRQADSFLHLEKAFQEAERQLGDQARALPKVPCRGWQRAPGTPLVLRVIFRLRVWVTSGVRSSQKAVKGTCSVPRQPGKKGTVTSGLTWVLVEFRSLSSG